MEALKQFPPLPLALSVRLCLRLRKFAPFALSKSSYSISDSSHLVVVPPGLLYVPSPQVIELRPCPAYFETYARHPPSPSPFTEIETAVTQARRSKCKIHDDGGDDRRCCTAVGELGIVTVGCVGLLMTGGADALGHEPKQGETRLKRKRNIVSCSTAYKGSFGTSRGGGYESVVGRT